MTRAHTHPHRGMTRAHTPPHRGMTRAHTPTHRGMTRAHTPTHFDGVTFVPLTILLDPYVIRYLTFLGAITSIVFIVSPKYTHVVVSVI